MKPETVSAEIGKIQKTFNLSCILSRTLTGDREASKKRQLVVISLFVLAVILIAAFAANQYFFSEVSGEKQPFYVGVTFCGDNAQDARLLVDRVKDYTNLFVLQSGPLIANGDAVFEIGDYAISKGLHFAAYFSDNAIASHASWVGDAEERWGSMFVGLYYGDEPGGKMLDARVTFTPTGSISNVSINGIGYERVIKNVGGDIRLSRPEENIVYQPDGEIGVIKRVAPSIGAGASNVTTYYPNGTITFQK